jgi:hypothetical protein
MDTVVDGVPRRRKTAAERRAQRLRAEGRMLLRVSKALASIQSHRGNALGNLGSQLLEALQSGNTLHRSTEGSREYLEGNLPHTLAASAPVPGELPRFQCIRGCGPLVRGGDDEQGSCDACGGQIPDSRDAIVCRSCDFWLCETCRVRLIRPPRECISSFSSSTHASELVDAPQAAEEAPGPSVKAPAAEEESPPSVAEEFPAPSSGASAPEEPAAKEVEPSSYKCRLELRRAIAARRAAGSRVADCCSLFLPEFGSALRQAASDCSDTCETWDEVNALRVSRDVVYQWCCTEFFGGTRDPRGKSRSFYRWLVVLQDVFYDR